MIDKLPGETTEEQVDGQIEEAIQEFKNKQGQKMADTSKWWTQEANKTEKWFKIESKEARGGFLIKCRDNITRVALNKALLITGWRRKNKAYVHLTAATRRGMIKLFLRGFESEEEEDLATELQNNTE